MVGDGGSHGGGRANTNSNGRNGLTRRGSMKLLGSTVFGLALSTATTGEARGFFHDKGDSSGSNTNGDRIHDFAHWAANLDLNDVPDDVVEKTELQIGNVLAAASSGSGDGVEV
ncbi:MAG: hypothetical protein SXQ77_05030, partial [Halobacteria archaeon]|nr:hypothetical protein [Halobacteria archaeon]